MNEAFEKILERLSRKVHNYYPSIDHYCLSEHAVKMSDIKEIVQEVSEEYASTENINCSTDTSTDGWIPCSERLPEENKDGWTHLILSIKTGEVIFGFWHNEEMGFCKHFRDGVCRVCGVIAWMPLPEPFKEHD